MVRDAYYPSGCGKGITACIYVQTHKIIDMINIYFINDAIIDPL